VWHVEWNGPFNGYVVGGHFSIITKTLKPSKRMANAVRAKLKGVQFEMPIDFAPE